MLSSKECFRRLPALVVDERERILFCNEVGREYFPSFPKKGMTLDEWMGKTAYCKWREAMGLERSYPTRIFRWDETEYWVDSYPGGGEAERWLIFDPDTQKLSGQRDLVDEASLNGITSLPNLSNFIGRFDRLLKDASHSEEGAVFLLSIEDLDRFSQREDHFDHRILRHLAQRMAPHLQEGDLWASVAYEKFALVCPGIKTPEEAREYARRLVHLFSEPVFVGEEINYLHFAMGVALFPRDGREAGLLLQRAEQAMRKSREGGWNRFNFYHPPRENLDFELRERLRKELPAALEKGEIFFAFQPQYSTEDEAYRGAELLVRWRHPQLGTLSPSLFLPLAEESGMMRPLTLRALMEAGKMFQRLSAHGVEGCSLSVNLSPSVVFYEDFLEDLRFVMDNYSLRDRRICLELTEEILAHNFEELKRMLYRYREMGMKIEIDDFGTGHSSLSYVTQLPVDTIKIDRSFVAGLHRDGRKAALFQAIYGMARALECSVVAEGVECGEEEKYLRGIGPMTMQGWHFAQALEAQEFLEFLLKREAE